MGHHNSTDKKYIAEHYIREKHILTMCHKEILCSLFVFKDENGTEYYHEAETLPFQTEQGWVNKPITKFGKWAESCSIGESIYVSFYMDKTSRGNKIFDVRMNKGAKQT